MLLGLWCLAVLTIVSCDPSDEVKPNPPTIELGSSTVEAAGGPQFLHVKSDISWTLSIVSEYGETLDWISVDRTTGAGDCNVVMKVSPNSSDEGRTATIVVTSEAGEDSVVLTQKGKASSSNPSGGNLSPKTGWLELPAIPDGTDAFTQEDKKLFFHLGLRQSGCSVDSLSAVQGKHGVKLKIRCVGFGSIA